MTGLISIIFGFSWVALAYVGWWVATSGQGMIGIGFMLAVMIIDDDTTMTIFLYMCMDDVMTMLFLTLVIVPRHYLFATHHVGKGRQKRDRSH